jgi:predicted RNA binding protein YcfA (HicA-like mRNA interferase family)
MRKLEDAGYVKQRTGKGSHRQFVHPTTGKVMTIAVHTKKEVGKGLANRIMKEAGLK